MMDDSIRTVELITGHRHGREARPVSQPLNLCAQPGEFVLLLGPNGSGKSTLMQTLSGQLRPLSGEVYLRGHNLREIKARDVARLLSLVLTDRVQVPLLRARGVVEIGRYPYLGPLGKLTERDHRIVAQAIQQCHLTGYEERSIVELSDGERQRVMIARALAQETPIMLLDEPTAHLDVPSRLEVMLLLRSLAEQTQRSIIASTHELHIALQWADTIWLVGKQGEIHTGAPEDLILEGRIEEAFGGDGLHFDSARGDFSLAQPPIRSIPVHGEGVRLEWTKKALARRGFQPVDSPDSLEAVGVLDQGWIHQGASYPTLRALLKHLEEIHANHRS